MSLILTGISKSFGEFRALDDVSFRAERGRVHALLGENGAGKSTLMNVAAGLYTPDAGAIIRDGEVLHLAGPDDALRRRIGMVHQHFKLVPPFTVAENLMLSYPNGSYRNTKRWVEGKVADCCSMLGFALDAHRVVDTLSVAEQQRCEIVRMLVGGADILILDEPTSVLTDAEARSLLAAIRRLAEQGAAVVLVTHKLADVTEFADDVTIMRHGRVIATLDPKAVSTAELTRLTVGVDIAPVERVEASSDGDTLRIAALTAAREDGVAALDRLSLSVRGGEIYGIAGISGNGQSELAEILMGVRRPSSGSVEMKGPGMASISADRQAFGIAGQLSVRDNLIVKRLAAGRYGSPAWIDVSAMDADADEAVAAFDVQGVRSLRQQAALLSGGNAQKLVLARELRDSPGFVLAHSPGRGLDSLAANAVQRRLLAARGGGAAVLLISDDLDEVLGLADRVGVINRGRIVVEFLPPFDRQRIGAAMVNHA